MIIMNECTEPSVHLLLDLVDEGVQPGQDKTNIIHEFTVDRKYQSLEISYNFTPKMIEDIDITKQQLVKGIHQYILDVLPDTEPGLLKTKLLDSLHKQLPLLNHMTLSLDYEEHYIGAAHRHASRQELRISEDYSSPGFIRSRIQPGTWRIMLNVHAALTDLRYSLRVIGKEGLN